MQQLWNDPKDTMPLASFAKKDRRQLEREAPKQERLSTSNDRRTSLARTLHALFKL